MSRRCCACVIDYVRAHAFKCICLIFVVNMCILRVKNPNGLSGLCAASYRMVASHAGCHPSTPEGGIGTRVGQALGPRAPPLVNKPRPGDADAPVINGLLLGLLTVITACVFGGNVDFQLYFHGFITAIARLITTIRLLLKQ